MKSPRDDWVFNVPSDLEPGENPVDGHLCVGRPPPTRMADEDQNIGKGMVRINRVQLGRGLADVIGKPLVDRAAAHDLTNSKTGWTRPLSPRGKEEQRASARSAREAVGCGPAHRPDRVDRCAHAQVPSDFSARSRAARGGLRPLRLQAARAARLSLLRRGFVKGIAPVLSGADRLT
jgi:hypothetical protein